MVRDTVKRIILCEGKHEIILFSLLLQKHEIPFDTKTWGQVQSRSKNSGEVVTIRDFLGKRGHGKSQLIKEEHGRDNCIKQFSLLYGYGDENRYSVKVIVDPDGGYCLNKLKQKMREDHKGVTLSQIDEFQYTLTTSDRYRIFIYPTTLTQSVWDTLKIKTDFKHGDDELYQLFKRYLEHPPEWINALEDFLRI